VIAYEKFRELNKADYNLIPIIMYAGHYISSTRNIDEFKLIDYTIPDVFFNNEFKTVCSQIDYLHLDFAFLNNKFIIIHHRFDQPITKLNKILNIVMKSNILQIVIFNNDIARLKRELDDDSIFFVDNLQVYASLLHNENCVALVSEWSGGGQVSQYVSNAKIIYYHETWGDNNSKMTHTEREKASLKTTFVGLNYDYKCITDCTKVYFNNYDDLEKNLESELALL